MKKSLKENPTLLLTFGFIYISILGYFSSSKFLNYFNIKATDYFTFEDFVLSIVREGDLFLFLLLIIPVSYMQFFWFLCQQKSHAKRISDLIDEIDCAGNIENLSKEGKEKLVTKAEKLKMYKIALDSYPEKIKKAISSAPIYFCLLSIPTAWQVANLNYLDVKTGQVESVRFEVRDKLKELDAKKPYVLLLRTTNHTFLLKDKGDNSSAMVIPNSNIISVYYGASNEKSS
ncbi:hypothetical protein [Photobacterium angustum]|uniref:Uncharacterized protein n=1 Tax=Photobacterium angustum TaxID=661 RepID=A0A2S7VKR7_PHOAN|nr:hypothetical protein [Photobacterium angustum]PQJ62668.1 hypothetical protein BTO08_20800 [Photobacterium angustum]